MILGRPPPAAASGAGMELVSFSEQVPASQRLTLQQQVATFGKDEIFHPDGERPPTLDDRDASQDCGDLSSKDDSDGSLQGRPVGDA